MKVEIKNIDSTKRELTFKIPKERVSQKLNEVYEGIGREAKVKGFRPGKAPRHVLEQHYGKLAHEEMVKQIIPEAYQEAIEKEKLAPIDLPDIEDVSFKDGIVSFTAKMDIKPEVKIKSYKGIKVKRKSAEVTDEEIKKTLEFLKKGQGKEKEIIIDDAFAKGLGYPNLEDFKNSLRRQMEIDKDRQNRIEVENQIVDHLIKNASLTVPSSAVKRQLEHRMEDQKKHLTAYGLKKEDIDKRIEESKKDLEKASQRDIQLYFILGKIAEMENINVSKEENLFNKVMEYLLKEANWEEGK